MNMTANHDMHPAGGAQLLLAFPFALALVLYILAVLLQNRKHKPWPIALAVSYAVGSLFAIIAVAGPLASRASVLFEAHMLTHLLLGMLAPLLMALAAPMTLLLRTLPVSSARRMTTLLRSRPFRLLTHPAAASLLHIGGLAILYTTSLYSLMHESSLLFALVHVHLFAAGYLFTVSIIHTDPIIRRVPYLHRAAALVAASACHGILSKHIYASPPDGIPFEQAEQAGILMYYGGDIVDIVLVFILCLHWYKAARPRAGCSILPQPEKQRTR